MVGRSWWTVRWGCPAAPPVSWPTSCWSTRWQPGMPWPRWDVHCQSIQPKQGSYLCRFGSTGMCGQTRGSYASCMSWTQGWREKDWWWLPSEEKRSRKKHCKELSAVQVFCDMMLLVQLLHLFHYLISKYHSSSELEPLSHCSHRLSIKLLLSSLISRILLSGPLSVATCSWKGTEITL